MDFLGYSLGRLVHGFEDDSESSIDLTQELTGVPLFRWDYCVTSTGKTLDSDFWFVYLKKILGRVPLAEWRLLKQIILYTRQN